MNRVDARTLTFQMDYVIPGLLMAVAGLVVIVAAAMGTPASQRPAMQMKAWIFAVCLSVTLLLMIGLSIKTDHGVILPPMAHKSQEPVLPRQSESSAKEVESNVDPKAELDLQPESSVSEPTTSVTALPDWTQQPTSTAGSTTLAVVRSGRFASREEAEQHAFDEAVKAVTNHFRRLDPRGLAAHSDAQRELVRQTAIRLRFDEVSRHDFGTMKNHPMHQVWLQLELSPTLGDKLAEPWRHSAVETRLRTLTGWAIWLTVAATVITIGLRLDSASHGERRRAICFVTVFLIVGSLAIVA